MGGYTVLISGDPIGDIFYQDLDQRITSTQRENFFWKKVLWPLTHHLVSFYGRRNGFTAAGIKLSVF